MTRARSLLAGLLVALAAACSSTGGATPDPTVPAGYEAVPDEELFSVPRSLPGVRASDLRYVDELGQSRSYRGRVTMQEGLPEERVDRTFDTVLRVLRHGRFGASYEVDVQSGSYVAGGVTFDLTLAEDYEARYGEQTGQEGWPLPSLRTG
ncbi:hypothetical protein [Nocardioides sp. AX2bis]|uniref:hypothetical protein n=1 Tax=Nocardioides sp. AX2bis TaxID=2653157 RepID=UPI0012F4546A|nr:hypothetical protein [Nocardioides sp. AX2bis]VXC07081.1 exported hypothetical protein [Nocardioides sp. AX2bis]